MALFAAIRADRVQDTSQIVTSLGTFPRARSRSRSSSARLAAAGAGGANNLVQSNWIRDKGFGMGSYVPRIVSPITGKEEAAPTSERFSFPQDEENLGRWKRLVEAREPRAVRVLRAASRRSRSSCSRWWPTRPCSSNPDLPDSSGFDFIALESLRARRARSAVVRHDVPGGRRDQPVRGRAGHRRLRLAAAGRHRPHRLHARELEVDRIAALLRRRLDDDRVRLRDPAVRLRPAARAASRSRP